MSRVIFHNSECWAKTFGRILHFTMLCSEDKHPFSLTLFKENYSDTESICIWLCGHEHLPGYNTDRLISPNILSDPGPPLPHVKEVTHRKHSLTGEMLHT